jgi:uncharacterized membrane protein
VRFVVLRRVLSGAEKISSAAVYAVVTFAGMIFTLLLLYEIRQFAKSHAPLRFMIFCPRLWLFRVSVQWLPHSVKFALILP